MLAFFLPGVASGLARVAGEAGRVAGRKSTRARLVSGALDALGDITSAPLFTPCRVTSLIRNRPHLGPYSRTMPGAL